mmetsp:Transcript_67145/g.181510  ORF Transcript_67145/g.181510 Transcript_67145/m.181510 type:complete len:419 (-) Transcript_67145:168-1424(-)
MPGARRWGRKSDEGSVPVQSAKNSDAHEVSKLPRWGKPHVEHVSSGHPVLCNESDGARMMPAHSARRDRQVTCRWYESGQNHEATLSLQDEVPRPALSPAAIQYRHHLIAIWMRKEGRTQTDVAIELGRAEPWVSKCWSMAVDDVKRPREVAKYVGEYEARMVKEGIQPFRPPSLHRMYTQDCAGIYEECVAAMPWRQAVLRKRNYETGEVTITNIASNRQDCTFPTLRTGIARLDCVLQRVKTDFQIRDPGAYVICNWYPDGSTNIAPHQHDFWSAILSFGASRVFTLDWQPLLLGDGDLLVFGTQRHSVPKMPSVKAGRVSVAVFWYPERRKADASLSISLDPHSAKVALTDGSFGNVLGNAAIEQLNDLRLDVGARGVGRYTEEAYFEDGGEEDSELLSEDRLVEIALQVSMLEK